MLTDDHQMHPTIYARKISIVFDAVMQERDLKSGTEKFLTELILDLRNEGCKLIGHIKGLFTADVKGHLMFSVTSFAETAHFKGKLHAGITRAFLTVNVIVYGVGLTIVEDAFTKAFRKHLSAHYSGSGSMDL